MKTQKVYVATLDRFGGTLTTAETTEQKAISAIMKEYRAMYKGWNNGANPTREEVSNAKEDIDIDEFPFGEVHYY